jgi:hypothetical protein
MLTTFDTPDSNTCAVKRERSNTPLQALTLLNDAVFVECAQSLARLVLADADSTTDTRLDALYLQCLGRKPDEVERPLLHSLLQALRHDFAGDETAARTFAGEPDPPAVPIAELAAWVGLARAVLNLDEFLTRE